jgi:hypothetical protein
VTLAAEALVVPTMIAALSSSYREFWVLATSTNGTLRGAFV